MEKTYITNGKNTYKLYYNIESLYGEWMLETEGQLETLSSLEDADATDEIDYVEEIINDSATPWEECDENDKKYVNKWLDIWGITSARNFQGGLDRG